MSELDRIRSILVESRTVAVLGAHADPAKAAHYVPAYMAEQGYRIIPVNPRYAGTEMFGERVRAELAEVAEPVDVLDVFRRGSHLAAHLPEILAMSPRPKVVWLQLGVRDTAVERVLVNEGIELVADRCMLADHRRLGIGRVG